MKTIAVITGASSGMGREFAKTIAEYGKPLDEVWVIARRADRLEALSLPYPMKALPMDLTDRSNFRKYKELLETEDATVSLLINASGFGRFCATLDADVDENLNMVDLNCQAVQAMCQLTIPHMDKGSQIINIASVAGSQPIPYINVYAATKAFVLHYSRALNKELKSRGIAVMALCPYWTKTEFFSRAIDDEREKVVKKYVAMYTPEFIVATAWKAMHRGKDLCIPGGMAWFQCLLTKILPHSLVMKVWMAQQGLK